MPVSSEDAIRAEAFLTAYNRIDDELRRRLKLKDHQSFRSAVDMFAKRNRWWHEDAEAMRAFAELRNMVVHDRFDSFRYLSVPSAEVVQEIEAIAQSLLRPVLSGDRFRRKVFTVDIGDSVTHALAVFRNEDISQLPAYAGDDFKGLITGNSVLRWLARKADREDGLVDLTEETVAGLLRFGEARRNFEFIGRDLPVREAAFLFAENSQLEALLMTEHGKPHQTLLGIATQWDVNRPLEPPA